MKKVFVFSLLFVVFGTFNSHAQEFDMGTNLVSLGVGFGSNIGSYTTSSQSPGLSFRYERGVIDAGDDIIGIGGYVGYKSFKYDYGNDEDKWTYTIVGLRGAYHINSLEVENLDVYAGAMLSYNFLSYTGMGSYGGLVGYSFFAGANYYFAENLGVMFELGYGVSYLNLGATFRF